MLCHSFIGGGFQHGELVCQERTHFPGLRIISKTLRRQIDSQIQSNRSSHAAIPT